MARRQRLGETVSETSDAGMETGPALSALACVEETKSDFGETERRECGERTGTWIEYDGMGKHGRKDSAGTSTEFDEMGRWGRPEVKELGPKYTVKKILCACGVGNETLCDGELVISASPVDGLVNENWCADDVASEIGYDHEVVSETLSYHDAV